MSEKPKTEAAIASRKVKRFRYGWIPDRNVENEPIFKADPSKNILDPFTQPTSSSPSGSIVGTVPGGADSGGAISGGPV